MKSKPRADIAAFASSKAASLTGRRCGTCKIKDDALHAQIAKAAAILKAGNTRLTVSSTFDFLKREWGYPLRTAASLRYHIENCLGS